MRKAGDGEWVFSQVHCERGRQTEMARRVLEARGCSDQLQVYVWLAGGQLGGSFAAGPGTPPAQCAWGIMHGAFTGWTLSAWAAPGAAAASAKAPAWAPARRMAAQTGCAQRRGRRCRPRGPGPGGCRAARGCCCGASAGLRGWAGGRKNVGVGQPVRQTCIHCIACLTHQIPMQAHSCPVQAALLAPHLHAAGCALHRLRQAAHVGHAARQVGRGGGAQVREGGRVGERVKPAGIGSRSWNHMVALWRCIAEKNWRMRNILAWHTDATNPAARSPHGRGACIGVAALQRGPWPPTCRGASISYGRQSKTACCNTQSSAACNSACNTKAQTGLLLQEQRH